MLMIRRWLLRFRRLFSSPAWWRCWCRFDGAICRWDISPHMMLPDTLFIDYYLLMFADTMMPCAADIIFTLFYYFLMVIFAELIDDAFHYAAFATLIWFILRCAYLMLIDAIILRYAYCYLFIIFIDYFTLYFSDAIIISMPSFTLPLILCCHSIDYAYAIYYCLLADIEPPLRCHWFYFRFIDYAITLDDYRFFVIYILPRWLPLLLPWCQTLLFSFFRFHAASFKIFLMLMLPLLLIISLIIFITRCRHFRRLLFSLPPLLRVFAMPPFLSSSFFADEAFADYAIWCRCHDISPCPDADGCHYFAIDSWWHAAIMPLLLPLDIMPQRCHAICHYCQYCFIFTMLTLHYYCRCRFITLPLAVTPLRHYYAEGCLFSLMPLRHTHYFLMPCCYADWCHAAAVIITRCFDYDYWYFLRRWLISFYFFDAAFRRCRFLSRFSFAFFFAIALSPPPLRWYCAWLRRRRYFHYYCHFCRHARVSSSPFIDDITLDFRFFTLISPLFTLFISSYAFFLFRHYAWFSSFDAGFYYCHCMILRFFDAIATAGQLRAFWLLIYWCRIWWYAHYFSTLFSFFATDAAAFFIIFMFYFLWSLFDYASLLLRLLITLDISLISSSSEMPLWCATITPFSPPFRRRHCRRRYISMPPFSPFYLLMLRLLPFWLLSLLLFITLSAAADIVYADAAIYLFRAFIIFISRRRCWDFFLLFFAMMLTPCLYCCAIGWLFAGYSARYIVCLILFFLPPCLLIITPITLLFWWPPPLPPCHAAIDYWYFSPLRLMLILLTLVCLRCHAITPLLPLPLDAFIIDY